MLNNQVSFERVMLNITTKADGLNLNKGEIVKGIVHSVAENGLVMISLKGRITEALCQIAVRPGEELFLIVDDFKHGKAYLKPITPTMMNEIENKNIKAQLLEIGIPAKEETIMMAKKLLQHNLPVTNNNLADIQKGTKILGEFNPRNLEITAFALSRGININQNLLQVLNQYVNNQSDVSRLFTDIKNLLSVLNNQLNINIDNAKPNMQTNTNNINQDILNIRSEFIPQDMSKNQNLSKSVNEPRFNIENLPNNTLNNFQNNLQQNSQEMNRGINPNGQISMSNNQIFNGIIFKQVLNLANQLLNNTEIKINEPTTEIFKNLQNRINSEQELIKNITILKEFIKNTRINNSLIQNLASKFEGLERELSGQRIFNSLPKIAGDHLANYYYLSIPVLINDEYRLCSLKVNKEFKNKNHNEIDNIKLVIAHETQRLGIVLFHIDWHKNGFIKLRGVVETEEVSNYLSENINTLLEKLNNLGFKVENLGIKVSLEEKELAFIRPRFDTTPQMKTFSIDLTV